MTLRVLDGNSIAGYKKTCYNSRMRRILKDHFIPHKGNDYKPHFLRAKIAAGILALVLVIEGLYLTQTLVILPKSDYLAAIFAAVLVNQTNDVRETQALGTLTPNPVLEKVAQMKADDMAAKGYFSHNTPDGKTPWYWFKQAGYAYLAAGENLAVNFTDSKDVTDAWLNSPSHRANIMNGNYTEIGIATAQGVYKGRNAIFVVEVFGLPAKVLTEEGRPVPRTLVPSAPTSPANVTKATELPAVKSTPTPALPAPTTVVAGAETNVAKELAVETADLEQPVVSPVEVEVLAPETHTPTDVSFLAALLASPRHLTTAFYLILGAILLLALGLVIFIEVRVQHPHLVVSGFLLLIVIVAIVAINSSVSLAHGVI